MKPSAPEHAPTPPDCFRLEELEKFQSLEGKTLSEVNYYFWINRGSETPLRFLFYLELIFDSFDTLLLTSGEDSEAIRVSQAETLIQTAEQLRELNGVVSIQRVQAGSFPLWQPVNGAMLDAIRLSKNEEGLYLNDAILLDFGQNKLLLRLSEQEGLEIAPFQ